MGSTDLNVQTENGQLSMPSNICCVVVEYLPGGALKSYLIKNRRRKLAFKVVIQLALDLARGWGRAFHFFYWTTGALQRFLRLHSFHNAFCCWTLPIQTIFFPIVGWVISIQIKLFIEMWKQRICFWIGHGPWKLLTLVLPALRLRIQMTWRARRELLAIWLLRYHPLILKYSRRICNAFSYYHLYLILHLKKKLELFENFGFSSHIFIIFDGSMFRIRTFS